MTINKSEVYQIIYDYFCDKPVKKVMVFGSLARNEQCEGSDVDILVIPSQPVSIFSLAIYRRELAELLAIDVDLTTPAGIDPNIYISVEKEMEVVYAAKTE